MDIDWRTAIHYLILVAGVVLFFWEGLAFLFAGNYIIGGLLIGLPIMLWIPAQGAAK